jgi:putative transposase
MPNYRRANAKGGTYFFTVVTYRRQKFLCNENVRNALRDGIRDTQTTHPFTIDAWVLLPDHLHCIWTLPPNDANFGTRWAMIKRFVTKQCGPSLYRDEWMTQSKLRRKESTIWQRRFWEHQIRDERDYERHMDYIHYNPVKHGYVENVRDWPHSTFHRYVRDGVYAEDWGSAAMTSFRDGFGE